jgi:hypothetical protein
MLLKGVQMNKHKEVSLKIRVQDKDFCWDGHTVCEQFDNDGGVPSCKFFYITHNWRISASETFTGYPKPKKCLDLK